MVASIATIWVSTLLFVTTLGVIFSGYNLLLMREIAVNAARQGALAEGSVPKAEDYALKMLKDSIPNLANHQVRALRKGDLLVLEIQSNIPGLGLLNPLIESKVVASAVKEQAI